VPFPFTTTTFNDFCIISKGIVFLIDYFLLVKLAKSISLYQISSLSCENRQVQNNEKSCDLTGVQYQKNYSNSFRKGRMRRV